MTSSFSPSVVHSIVASLRSIAVSLDKIAKNTSAIQRPKVVPSGQSIPSENSYTLQDEPKPTRYLNGDPVFKTSAEAFQYMSYFDRRAYSEESLKFDNATREWITNE